MNQTQAPTYYSRRLVAYVSDLWRRREFAWFLALGNFEARNASITLGLFWWILNPLLLSLVYYLVFGLIFPGARDIIYLMSGMFVFHFTAQSLTGSMPYFQHCALSRVTTPTCAAERTNPRTGVSSGRSPIAWSTMGR